MCSSVSVHCFNINRRTDHVLQLKQTASHTCLGGGTVCSLRLCLCDIDSVSLCLILASGSVSVCHESVSVSICVPCLSLESMLLFMSLSVCLIYLSLFASFCD